MVIFLVAKIEQNIHEVIQNEISLSILKHLEDDPEVLGYLRMANVTLVNHLGYNEHGIHHARIVTSSSAQIFHLLKNTVKFSVMEDLKMTEADTELAIVVGAFLHDIGNSVHRNDHFIHGVTLANPILDRQLTQFYSGKTLAEMKALILQIIYSHDESVPAIIPEAGVVTVSDGTDITSGRAITAYTLGKLDIHSISAMSIQKLEIQPGKQKPVRFHVTMRESAGIFQVQEVLGPKLASSGLKDHIEVYVETLEGDGLVVELMI